MAGRFRGELTMIALVGLAALLFLFWIIPAHIPTVRALGGTDSMPRFVPSLVGAGILAVLAGRAIRILVRPEPDPQPIWEGTHINKATAIIAMAMAYAFLGIGYLGFYIASAVMGVCTMLVLGERRPGIIMLVIVVVLAGIYGLFEQALGLFMPAGQLVDVARLFREIFQ